MNRGREKVAVTLQKLPDFSPTPVEKMWEKSYWREPGDALFLD